MCKRRRCNPDFTLEPLVNLVLYILDLNNYWLKSAAASYFLQKLQKLRMWELYAFMRNIQWKLRSENYNGGPEMLLRTKNGIL